MGIIGTALGEAAGMTMNQVGTAMIAADIRREENEGRWALEREKMAKDIELRRQELNERRREADLRWGDGEGGSSSSGGKKGGLEGVIADMIKKNPDLYGLNQPLPGADKFTTSAPAEVDPSGADPGATVSKYDAEGHEKAKRGIIDSNIERAGQVRAKDYEDLEKGKGQAMLNDLLAQAKAETDPARREVRVQDLNKIAIAAGAKERFDVKDGTVIDVATGANKETAVGKSEIKKNEGAANESNADARKASAKGTDGMSKTELIQHNTNLRTTMGSLERELKSERALLADLPKGQRADKQARIDSLVKELDTVRAEIRATDKKVSGASTEPAADKPKAEAKAPEAPRDLAKRENGKRYSTPRGDLIWVSDGKQQGWRKP